MRPQSYDLGAISTVSPEEKARLRASVAKKSPPKLSKNTRLHAALRLGLTRAMDERDISPAKLASKSGWGQSTIGAFLNGKAGTSIEALDAFLKVLNLTPEQFFARCDPAWPGRQVQPDHTGGVTHAGKTESTTAAIDTLKAAINVAVELLERKTAPSQDD